MFFDAAQAAAVAFEQLVSIADLAHSIGMRVNGSGGLAALSRLSGIVSQLLFLAAIGGGNYEHKYF